MKKTITALLASVTLFLSASVSDAKEAVKKQKVVFDASHAEIFSPLKEGPLNYSNFAKLIEEKHGAKVTVNGKPITKEVLKGVNAYIIAGPMKPLADDEISALNEYVKKGGSLLVMLHISSPAARLTEGFGIVVSTAVIAESEDLIEGQPQDFLVKRFPVKHPVNSGLAGIALYGSWALMTDPQAAKLAAVTSEKAWADMNRNRKYDEGEPSQSFGVIAIANPGKGKVAVVADDAPFANSFLGIADNSLLASNIMNWFLSRPGK